MPEQYINTYVSLISDLALALLLGAFGHFGYAAMKVVEQFFERELFSMSDELRELPKEAHEHAN